MTSIPSIAATESSLSATPIGRRKDNGSVSVVPSKPNSREADTIVDNRPMYEEVSQLAEGANERLRKLGMSASISFDVKFGRAVLSITDIQTNRVIVQIPSEVSQKLQKQLDQLSGFLVDRYE